jgi:O-acetyl-ADP-ribose deacetylase (regulator of RNase III)
MQWKIGNGCLELCQGDITDQHVDAVVNAANSQLAGGGGVDGAIHRRGGAEIMRETRERFPEGCQTGAAVVTSAGTLDAKFVIHAVGPVWQGGNRGEAALLEAAYHCCLELAAQHECHSVAFPSLSTGAYRYPVDQASQIAIRTAVERLREHDVPEVIRFVLFDAPTLGVFQQTAQQMLHR